MNYRHAFHAGNFADVLKHAVLALVVSYMKQKDAGFRVIDTHAGRGHYSLASPEAGRTQEWRSGIGRLIGPSARALPAEAMRVLAPYLEAVEAANPPGTLETYPGSPMLALHLMRPQDRLIACELHPEEHAALVTAIGRERRAKVLALDGWTALRSLLPPRERRGLVLIDPPYEEDGELVRLVEGLDDALRRFATGTYIAWYPIKDAAAVARFRKKAAMLAPSKMLDVELLIRRPQHSDVLNGCGLIVVNPPFTLEEQLRILGPALARHLAAAPGAQCSVRWLKALDRDPPAPTQRRRVRRKS